jgi:uncharacterized protein (DUF169 family)
MQGHTFYTVPSDHYNCAVGSHTHAIPLPPERAAELQSTIEFMVASRYLQMNEVPGIPVLEKAPAAIAYGPVNRVPFNPDAIIVAAPPASAMLMYEAALSAGAGGALANVLGRPGCAVLPLAGRSGAVSLSLGCRGSRIFSGLPESELYVVVPGRH